nr:hypothetical protein [Shewanella algae]
MNVMLKGDFSSTLRKVDISQVASIGLGPVLPTCAGMTMTQQKGFQPLLCLTQIEHGIFPAVDKVADSLIPFIRDINRVQIATTR